MQRNAKRTKIWNQKISGLPMARCLWRRSFLEKKEKEEKNKEQTRLAKEKKRKLDERKKKMQNQKKIAEKGEKLNN